MPTATSGPAAASSNVSTLWGNAAGRPVAALAAAGRTAPPDRRAGGGRRRPRGWGPGRGAGQQPALGDGHRPAVAACRPSSLHATCRRGRRSGRRPMPAATAARSPSATTWWSSASAGTTSIHSAVAGATPRPRGRRRRPAGPVASERVSGGRPTAWSTTRRVGTASNRASRVGPSGPADLDEAGVAGAHQRPAAVDGEHAAGTSPSGSDGRARVQRHHPAVGDGPVARHRRDVGRRAGCAAARCRRGRGRAVRPRFRPGASAQHAGR